MTLRILRVLTAVLVLPLSFIGCASARQQAPARAQMTETSPATLGEVSSDPKSFEGREVTLVVEFTGWKGACRSGPPVARSDWMVEDATGCLYVHGPLPPGLDPLKPSRQPLTLRGMVRVAEGGVPYLEMDR